MERFGHEYEPTRPIDFLEASKGLEEGEGLVLSRQRASLVSGEGIVYGDSAIEYKNLNFISDIYRVPTGGELITDGPLVDAAHRMSGNHDTMPGATYPFLIVVNDETDARVAVHVDVATLISQGRLPVYSTKARSRGGGEMLTLDMESLARALAGKVGMGPGGVVVKEKYGYGAESMREAVPSVQVHLAREAGAALALDAQTRLSLADRDEKALALLQLKAADMFMDSHNRAKDDLNGAVHVELRLLQQPDLNTTIIDLINWAEVRGGRIMYRYDWLETGVEGPTFWLVDRDNRHIHTLSADNELDLAIHNAYLMAKALGGIK